MVKSVIFTFAIAALALSAIASRAAITYKTPEIAAPTTCEKQAWPNFSDNCLLTISGDKSDRKFRVVIY